MGSSSVSSGKSRHAVAGDITQCEARLLNLTYVTCFASADCWDCLNVLAVTMRCGQALEARYQGFSEEAGAYDSLLTAAWQAGSYASSSPARSSTVI